MVTANPVSGAYQALAAPFRLETYSSLLCLALSFLLGLAAFVGLVTGFSLGGGLLITLLGVPILLTTLVAATVLARVEAGLVTFMIGVPVANPSVFEELVTDDGLTLPGDGFIDAACRVVTARSTWAAVILLLSKFVTGIVSFLALVTTSATCAVTVGAPLLYRSADVNLAATTPAGAEDVYVVGPCVVDTLPEALAVSAAGVVLTVVGLNLLMGLARLQAGCATVFLGSRGGSRA